MTLEPPQPPARDLAPRRLGFGEDFRRFFLRGLATVLPTLITLWLLVWAWNFLWGSLGRHILWGIRELWNATNRVGFMTADPPDYIAWAWREDLFATRLVGVLLAVLLVYAVGVIVGNFIGRTAWRLAEHGVLRIPLVRAIYPAVKQVTDFLLADRAARGNQFEGSRVVAVQPHEQNIWSIGLVTGPGLAPLSAAVGQEMVTVFIPSTPTAFSGYTLVVPREKVVELPLKVEEAMRLLITGGVSTPGALPNVRGREVPEILPPASAEGDRGIEFASPQAGTPGAPAAE